MFLYVYTVVGKTKLLLVGKKQNCQINVPVCVYGSRKNKTSTSREKKTKLPDQCSCSCSCMCIASRKKKTSTSRKKKHKSARSMFIHVCVYSTSITYMILPYVHDTVVHLVRQ